MQIFCQRYLDSKKSMNVLTVFLYLHSCWTHFVPMVVPNFRGHLISICSSLDFVKEYVSFRRRNFHYFACFSCSLSIRPVRPDRLCRLLLHQKMWDDSIPPLTLSPPYHSQFLYVLATLFSSFCSTLPCVPLFCLISLGNNWHGTDRL